MKKFLLGICTRRYSIAKAAFSLLCLTLVIFDGYSEKFTLSWISFAFILAALVPWMAHTIESFSISDKGFSARMRTIDAIIASQQEDDSDLTIELSEEDGKYLKALIESRWSMRSALGVSQSTRVEKQSAKDKLKDLEQRGLVRSLEQNGKKWWLATSAGRKAFHADTTQTKD